MSRSKTVIFVCVSCRQDGDPDRRPGRALLEALTQKLAATPQHAITVEPAECLAVCKRPATVALAGAGKWTYVLGDLDTASHVEDLVAAATSFHATENGIIPWNERPACMKKGVVSRTPPLPHDD